MGTPTKRRNYTMALQDLDQAKRVIEIIEKTYLYGVRWAYILHDKDVKEDGSGELKASHYHFYIRFENPRYISSVASELEVPVNMLQYVISDKGMIQYMTHKNQPDKYQYSEEEIVANFELSEFDREVDIVAEFEDFMRYKNGEITYQELLMSHNISIMKLSYYSRFRIYDVMSHSVGAGSLSPCRVPCSIHLVRGCSLCANNNKKGAL